MGELDSNSLCFRLVPSPPMLTYAASLNSFAVFWSLRLEVPSYSLPSYTVTMCGVDMSLASLVLHHPLAWSASFLLCLLHTGIGLLHMILFLRMVKLCQWNDICKIP